MVDMNLSPKWALLLHEHGHDAVHWSAAGAGNAPDADIAAWARRERRVVLTADLGFGSLLAAGEEDSPSVVQLRSADLRVSAIGQAVLQAIAAARDELVTGAFLSFDRRRTRLRLLPFHPSSSA